MPACHVEFIGIPGSGKSTVRRALLAELKKQGHCNFMASDEAFLLVARERIDKAYRVVLNSLPKKIAKGFAVKMLNRSLMQFDAQNAFLASYGEAFRIFLSSESFRELSTKDREIVIGGFLSAASMYQVIAEGMTDDATVLFDERFVQKSMMFVSTGSSVRESAECITNYLRNVPIADFTVYVRVDPENCIKRMKKRPTGLTLRLSTKEDAAVARFIKDAAAHMELIVNALRGDRRTTLIEVNNEEALDDAVSKLAGMLPREIGSRRA